MTPAISASAWATIWWKPTSGSAWACCCLVIIVVELLLGLSHRLRRSGGLFGTWLARSAERRARRRTTQGLLALAECNWPRARKLLEASATRAETPLINFLAAAQAAHEEGNFEEEDRLLRRAFESTPGSDLAVGLTQAQLQLHGNRLEKGLATLIRLRKQAPNHPFILKLLRDVYIRLEDWRELSSTAAGAAQTEHDDRRRAQAAGAPDLDEPAAAGCG